MNSDEPLPVDFPTPSLVVDARIVRQNLGRMQEYCQDHSLGLRPHTKTHKSKWMAQRQLEYGARSLTVAKAGEAEVMSEVCHEILIAYPTVGPARLEKVMRLAEKHRILVGLDSLEVGEMIQQAAVQRGVRIGILLDIDVGFHRTGVGDVQQAIQVAGKLASQSQLDFCGIMCFPGHLMPSDPPEQWQSYAEAVGVIVERFRASGLSTEVVSGGSTPTAMASHRNPWLTEIRPGTFIYNDMNEVRLGVASLEDCAARVIATVVSLAGPDKFVIDAGSKTLSSDRCGPAPESGFGHVVEYPEGKVVRLSEEHGEVQLPQGASRPRIGDRVSLIPNHICVCVNLQNHYWLKEANGLQLMAVDARGRLV